ncbi:MAG: O-antigen ligase family protein [Isosphaeraceae bacterium]|nr:O-antigen ligase family protein [Isosphaeraceae bacterium]
MASETVLLLMVCLAPWAFGAVEAWAQFLLVLGVLVLGLLRLPQQWGRSERSALACLPSVALGGLLVLALVQVIPWPARALGLVAPGQASLRKALLPSAPERVAGDSAPEVSLPRRSVSSNPEGTLQAAAGLACAWIVFQSVLSLGGGFAPYRRFALALVANATLLSLLSVIQRVAWNGKIYWLRDAPGGSAGPFVDHNHLAAYLNLGLGLSLGFLFAPVRDAGRRGLEGAKLWAGYAAGLIAVGVLVSLSRSGFLGMVAALVCAAVTLRADRLRLAAGFGGVLVVIALFFGALGGTLPYQKRIATLLGADPYANRLRVWTGALRAWPEAPVLGTGLGTFATATARFYPFDAGETYVHAENEYVEWLVEGGLVGIALVATATAGTFLLGRRALRAAPTPARRALTLGGLIALVTLVVHSGGDFALHIPGVALAAVALAAHLARLGLRGDPRGQIATAVPAPTWVRRVPWAACTALLGGTMVLVPAFRWARAEVHQGYAGMPLEGALFQTLATQDDDETGLDESRAGLEQALRDRPNWAEGHVGLGLVFLKLYERTAREALASRVADPVLRDSFARPLWLSLRVRASSPEEPLTAAALLKLDAVRAFLVPAARCFLEARRCDPLRPLPHTKLATLSFLLEGGDPGPVYLERALRLAGGSGLETARVAEVAVLWGELDLAARCWRRELALGTRPWADIADTANAFLPPGRILAEVVPDGPLAVRFAQRLYPTPSGAAARRLFAEEALRRLGRDKARPEAQRLEFGAEAHLLLGQRDKARARMLAALALEPARCDWRKTLVEWLIAWGRLDEAHAQARLAVSLAPADPDARAALELAAEALAHSDGDSHAADPERASGEPADDGRPDLGAEHVPAAAVPALETVFGRDLACSRNRTMRHLQDVVKKRSSFA